MNGEKVMNKPELLLSSTMITAIERLSKPKATLDTKTLISYGHTVNRKTKNYTINDIRIVIGSGGARRAALKHAGIPGYLIAMWMMDSPVTRYWKPKVERLGKFLGVNKGAIWTS
jgi:hypothetical protein